MNYTLIFEFNDISSNLTYLKMSYLLEKLTSELLPIGDLWHGLYRCEIALEGDVYISTCK